MCLSLTCVCSSLTTCVQLFLACVQVPLYVRLEHIKWDLQTRNWNFDTHEWDLDPYMCLSLPCVCSSLTTCVKIFLACVSLTICETWTNTVRLANPQVRLGHTLMRLGPIYVSKSHLCLFKSYYMCRTLPIYILWDLNSYSETWTHTVRFANPQVKLGHKLVRLGPIYVSKPHLCVFKSQYMCQNLPCMCLSLTICETWINTLRLTNPRVRLGHILVRLGPIYVSQVSLVFVRVLLHVSNSSLHVWVSL
jgi:hypothetical protein